MNKVILTTLSLLFLFGFTACKNKYDAGFTGDSSVSGKVVHHSEPIPNAIVYIKFNATEFPGTDIAVYDSSVAANKDGFYRIEGLHAGNYYLMGAGFDNGINLPVIGGIPVELQRNKMDFETDIPVTED